MALTPSRFFKILDGHANPGDVHMAFRAIKEHAPAVFWPDRPIPPVAMVRTGEGYIVLAQEHTETRTLTRTEAEDIIALIQDERKFRGW